MTRLDLNVSDLTWRRDNHYIPNYLDQINTDYSQATIVFVVALSAQDTSNEANGQKQNRNSPQYPCSQRPNMNLLDTLSRHINLTIWRHEGNLYLPIEDKPCVSTLSMADPTGWMTTTPVPRQYQVPLAPRTIDYLQSHIPSKHQLQLVL